MIENRIYQTLRLRFRIGFLLWFLCVLASLPGQAQLNLPEPSPEARIVQRVGLTDFRLVYSRPSARGRQVFGTLVPYGTLWRTGAGDATTIQVSDPVTIDGKKIPAGKYSFFSIPGALEWTLILNRDTTLHGLTGYRDSLDVLRWKVAPVRSSRVRETFYMELGDLIKDAVTLTMAWENTEVSFPIQTTADERVMAQIRERITVKKETNPRLLYQAALYYYDNEKDLGPAMVWIDQAIAGDKDFIYYHLQAKMKARLQDFKGAIASARESLKLAQQKKLTDYVKRNEQLIEEWSKRP